MPVVSQVTPISAPSWFAFAFLADPETATIVDPAVREYRPATTPMDVGVRVQIRLRLLGVPVRAESVIQGWEPPSRMEFAQVRPARPVKVSAVHTFEPDGDGCVYRWEIYVRANPRVLAPVARLVAWSMSRNAAAQGRRVRDEVERRWVCRETAADAGG